MIYSVGIYHNNSINFDSFIYQNGKSFLYEHGYDLVRIIVKCDSLEVRDILYDYGRFIFRIINSDVISLPCKCFYFYDDYGLGLIFSDGIKLEIYENFNGSIYLGLSGKILSDKKIKLCLLEKEDIDAKAML